MDVRRDSPVTISDNNVVLIPFVKAFKNKLLCLSRYEYYYKPRSVYHLQFYLY